jgi:pilus assembly protein Flp/PilA
MSAVSAYFVTLMFVVQDRFETRKERGATAVEYGLMVGLIAVAIIVAVGLLGTKLTGLFNGVASKIPSPAP